MDDRRVPMFTALQNEICHPRNPPGRAMADDSEEVTRLQWYDAILTSGHTAQLAAPPRAQRMLPAWQLAARAVSFRETVVLNSEKLWECLREATSEHWSYISRDMFASPFVERLRFTLAQAGSSPPPLSPAHLKHCTASNTRNLRASDELAESRSLHNEAVCKGSHRCILL
jgi:hypothetical protein